MRSKNILDDLFEEIICITEGKQNQPGKGVTLNLMQCKSSCEVSGVKFLFFHFVHTLNIVITIDEPGYAQEKRKADVAFDSEYEYVYGIVTTGESEVKI